MADPALEGAEVVEERAVGVLVEDAADELADGLVVLGVGVDPARVHLGLVQGLEHVVLDPLDERPAYSSGRRTAPAARRRRASGRGGIPRWRRGSAGRRRTCAAVRLVEPAPAVHAGPPVLGHLGEDVDPGADVLAALGVVGRQGRQGIGPSGLPVPVVGVDRLGPDAEPAGLAADLVERDQAVVDVEGRVLDPLGRHRRRHLLELAGEPPLLGPVLLAERSRASSSSSMSRMKRNTRRLRSGLRAMARRTAISM